VLEKILLFEGIKKESIENLEKRLKPRSYGKGETIIHQDDEGDSMYFIISGRLKVVSTIEDGKEALLDFLHDGDYFGELSLFDQERRSASVIAVEDSVLIHISRTELLGFLERHPEANLILLRSLARRIRGITTNLSSLAQLDVYGRIARVLLQEAVDEQGELVTPRMTQQDIGEMVGASREMVSKILKDLRIGGYISIQDKRIRIHRKLPSHW
jgi:CRP/FNR family cyclic AMP-dependent transcriptional regulator